MPDIFAGAAIGSLIGLLVSLSASPVVAVVVGALAALLGALTGLTESSPFAVNPRRVAAFGLAATISLLSGLLLRSYDVLSPSVEHYTQQLESAKVAPAEARRLAIRIKYGVSETGEVASTAASFRNGVFFAGEGANVRCNHTDRESFVSDEQWLAELGRRGWVPLLNATANVMPEARSQILAAAWTTLCA